jgi:hypothetical protein
MSVNMQSTKHAKWTTRVWRILAALNEVISISPVEHLEKRILQFWNRKCGPEVSRCALTRNRSPTKAFDAYGRDSWRNQAQPRLEDVALKQRCRGVGP